MRPAHRPPELLAGPFTVADARRAGLTAKQLRSSCWRPVLRGVYVASDREDTLELRCSAVRRVLPPDAVVGKEGAAWLHGADVRDARDDRLPVIAQRGDQIRIRGIAATSAQLLDSDVMEIHGVPVTTPVRTAFDLARRRDLIEAVVGVDAMLNRGGCDLRELQEYAAEHRGWRWVRQVDRAIEQAEPLSQSPMESRQRMRLVLAGLPRPRAQAPVQRRGEPYPFAYIDNGYERWRVGADYDGAVHAARWRQDLERQEGIRDEGWWHRRYTALHITAAWPQMVRQVGEALAAAGWSPGPDDHARVDLIRRGMRARGA